MQNSRKTKAVEITKNDNQIDQHSKVNLDKLYLECMEEMDLLEELVILFRQNALEFIGKIKLSIKNVDFKELDFATHKILAGLKMMKAFSLLAIVGQIHENYETTQDIKTIENLYNCFLKEYPIVEQAIGDEVERLKKM